MCVCANQVLGNVVGEEMEGEPEISEDEISDGEEELVQEEEKEEKNITEAEEEGEVQFVAENRVKKPAAKESGAQRGRKADKSPTAEKKRERSSSRGGNNTNKRKRGAQQREEPSEGESKKHVKVSTTNQSSHTHVLILMVGGLQEPRMTTNKRKVGVNFYDTHNVKNRNRDKKIPMKDTTRASKKRK